MDYFVHVPEYQLLGCRSCLIMVTRQRIKNHLQSSPHHLGIAEIKEVQKWASKIDIIQDQQEIHDSLPLVPDGTPPNCCISTTVSTCRYMGTSLKRIRQHLKDEHEWNLELKASRRSAAMAEQERSNNPWRSGVLYQRFFLTGSRSEYFEVARGLNLDGLRSKDHGSQVRLQQAIDAFQRKSNDVRSQEAGRIDARTILRHRIRGFVGLALLST
ncbi:hypothetical protein MRS44_017125 [Fusarium solani]|uniref:uncharacterized protein n=1 Tax=Fusarium solani TaxID=169388 RepID=UPI0032C3DD9D|nr:hypothetical protein MRS44_017125 [Fusarium solani]